MTTSRSKAAGSAAERFWVKVDKSGECWVWTAATANGYGTFGISSGEMVMAHRYSWTLQNGAIPDGLFILHRCDNRLCVRPEHLFLGTQADNMADMRSKGRGAIGVRHGSSRLTEADVVAIRERWADGVSGQRLATIFDVSLATVSCIVHGKRWAHVGGPIAAKYRR